MENTTKSKTQEISDIILHSRKELHVTGVFEIISATTNNITIKSTLGGLIVNGTDLKIKNLTSNSQEVDICGDINEIKYTSRKKKLFEKVFK